MRSGLCPSNPVQRMPPAVVEPAELEVSIGRYTKYAAMADDLYTDDFFAMQEEPTRVSAREAVPAVLEHVRAASVVDVGCGMGIWLAEFKARGVEDYLGIDGAYVRREKLLIDPSRFQSRDLSQPFEVGRRFDLALSLEVAEHLPKKSAESFVASLTALAPVVLFSAAIPYQGGTGHINEQWPEYWQDKFAHHDYVVVDCLRTRLWKSPTIMPWYPQNMLFFVEGKRLGEYPRLASEFGRVGPDPPLARVHPNIYLHVVDQLIKNAQHSWKLALQASTRLREINLLVFPSWAQPAEQLRDQLRRLLASLLAHPYAGRVSLLIDTAHEPGDFAERLVSEVKRELFASAGSQSARCPNISTTGDGFGGDQWEILSKCWQARVVLPDDNPAAVAFAGAHALACISLNDIERGQPFVKR
jgi:SAM-dependent methyltransferase